MASGTISNITGGLRLFALVINGTTNQYGILTVSNPVNSSSVFLLRNTWSDDVNGSFGVINVEGTSASEITLRFRTLSDGTVNANKQVLTTLIFAYR